MALPTVQTVLGRTEDTEALAPDASEEVGDPCFEVEGSVTASQEC